MRRIMTLALAALLAIALLAAPVAAKGDKAPSDATIVDIAEDSGEFSTLIFALSETGLDKVLDGKGQYTVFAPTDAAFAALPDGTLDYLVANPDVLTEVLLYHVTEGRRWSNSVFNANNQKPVTMLNGGYVLANPGFSLTDSDSLGLGSSDAKIVGANLSASNGVIHVINQVLIP